MRAFIFAMATSLLWAFLAVNAAWAETLDTATALKTDPNLTNIPEFPSYVTSSIAQQHIRADRAPRSQAGLLPSAAIVSSNPLAPPTFDRQPAGAAIDRRALYQYASLAAKSASMELINAYRNMITDGYMMQLPWNPPAVQAAGKQVVKAAAPHLKDAVQFDNAQFSTRRMADGGQLISSIGDANHPAPLPAGQPPKGFNNGIPTPTNFHTPASNAPPPFNPGPNGPLTASPPLPTTYVYTGANANVDPVGRNVAPTVPPVYQQVLIDRGVNPDGFAADLASGSLADPSAFLRAAGNTSDYSSSDLAKAQALAQEDFLKMGGDATEKKAEPQRHQMDEEKPEPGGAVNEGLLADALATERVKARRKDSAEAKDPGATALPGANLPSKLAALLDKRDHGGKLGASPVWYQWLTLGVIAAAATGGQRHPQNIFHIAHRQYQNVAPAGRASRDEVAVLDF